nr:immunoglobulin heavy chain junction region [Mus musculus]
CARGTLFSYW